MTRREAIAAILMTVGSSRLSRILVRSCSIASSIEITSWTKGTSAFEKRMMKYLKEIPSQKWDKEQIRKTYFKNFT
jgi:hypothetical protein